MKLQLSKSELTNYPSLASCAGSAHSWPEDYADENGNYLSKCLTCGEHFMGHKRRQVCKVCDSENQRWWEGLNDEQRREHIASVAGEVRRIFGPNEKIRDRDDNALSQKQKGNEI